MKHEHRTTRTYIQGTAIPQPVEPSGDGWELVGQGPGKDKHGEYILWSWRRQIDITDQNEDEEGEWLVQA